MIQFCDGSTWDYEDNKEGELFVYKEQNEPDGTKTFHKNNCICRIVK